MRQRIAVQRLFAAAQLGVAAFLILSFAAMPLYPGGTYRDPSTSGYRFFSNFFSDLGMPHAWSGAANPVGSVLFVSGEAILAAGVIGFFVGFVRLPSLSPSARAWSRAAAVAGAVIALALVLAGATPANRFEWIHLQAAKLAFRAACAATACLSVAIVLDRRFSRATVAASVATPVLLAIYLGILEWGPRVSASDYGLTFQATAQKAIVLTVLPAVFFLSRQAAARQRSEAAPAYVR